MAEAGVELGRAPRTGPAGPTGTSPPDLAARFRELRIPPWSIVAAAVLLTAVLGRFVADGRIKYGLGIALAVCYGPVAFMNLPVAFAIWVAVQFFAQLSALGYGPNGMSVLVGLGWIGAFLGGRARLGLVREHRRLLLAILLLCVWITLSAIWADKPGVAGTEAAYWWMAAFAFIITLTTIRSPRHISYIALAFVAGAVISVIIGLATGGLTPSAVSSSQTAIQGRLTGGGGDPNEQAAGFVAALFLMLGLFSVFERRIARTWLTLAFLLVAVGFFATESRGGLLALAAATVVALIIAPRQRRRIAGLAAVVGVACVALLMSSPGALQRITDLSGGTSGRSDLWRVGFEVFKGHTVVGVGAGNFVVVEPHYALQPGAISRIQYITETPEIVHNTYLQLLAETGIVGLLAYLAVVASSLSASFSAIRRFEAIGQIAYADLTRAVVLGTIGMLAALFFITDGNDPRLWVLLALGPVLLGLALRLPANPAARQRPRPRRRVRQWRPAAGVR
ncbi:MAG: O-antigen ligase family protein [Solirubrobacteraceae bacterium]